MSPLSALVILAALGPPDWLPPAPDVLFTPVDRNGNELSDNYPAVCGGETCRATLPVAFGDRACLVNGWVRLPRAPETAGVVLLSAGPCTKSRTWHPAETVGAGTFSLDAHGATSVTFAMAGRDPDAVELLAAGGGDALIRVDIVASTHARR
jgi:hypothetical protein